MKAVLIRWHDSVRTTGWRTVAEATTELNQNDFLDCETVGFLVGETGMRMMVALNRQAVAGGEPMVGETIVIPKAAIVARFDLTESGVSSTLIAVAK